MTAERQWWMKPEPETPPPVPRIRAVAYYRHSAQDRQENSVAIQQELVQKWASENGVDIIEEFADRGKSGLTVKGRDAFNDMMQNWVKKRDDFRLVLCLDVSRWGRFQNIDDSAIYSAECKRHGKDLVYTSMGRPRPDDPLHDVYVHFERFRAAQFSSELSVKVLHGCMKIAQQGFSCGGSPPYGYDRLLLDEARKPVQVLAPRQKKSIQNQRVTLTPANDEKAATVRRIFRERAKGDCDEQEIASRLNRDKIPAPSGGQWNGSIIRRILRNPKYSGTQVYNKKTQKLKTPSRCNPLEKWVMTPKAFEPLIDPDLFQQVQAEMAKEAERFTMPVMLEHLKRIIAEHGFVRPCLLRDDKQAPSSATYASRFASLSGAYQQLYSSVLGTVAREVENSLRKLVDQVESYDDFLVLNRKFTVLIQPSVPIPYGYHQFWHFQPDGRPVVDITLGVLVGDSDGSKILGYLALPRLLVRKRSIRLFESSHVHLCMHGYAGLDIISQLARA